MSIAPSDVFFNRTTSANSNEIKKPSTNTNNTAASVFTSERSPSPIQSIISKQGLNYATLSPNVLSKIKAETKSSNSDYILFMQSFLIFLLNLLTQFFIFIHGVLLTQNHSIVLNSLTIFVFAANYLPYYLKFQYPITSQFTCARAANVPSFNRPLLNI